MRLSSSLNVAVPLKGELAVLPGVKFCWRRPGGVLASFALRGTADLVDRGVEVSILSNSRFGCLRLLKKGSRLALEPGVDLVGVGVKRGVFIARL